MPTLMEREALIADALRDAFPVSLTLAQRTRIVRLIRRLIIVEIMIDRGLPEETGNVGGEEDTP